MKDWLYNPSPDSLYWQKDQQAFLAARRIRLCRTCRNEFIVSTSDRCPTCEQKGSRKWTHLTIIAGRRFGKSKMGSIAGTEEAMIPGSIGWACAPTNPKLHRYVIPAFQQLIPNEAVASYSAEFQDLRLKNGSLIHFQTLEHPDQGRGQGLDWLWIDEVCELTKQHWDVISPSLADRQGVAFFTTSPRSFDWVYDKFYKPAEEGSPGYWALHAKTRDNPKFWTTDGQAYLATAKAEMTDLMYRQEYEADFVTFEGSVYGDLIDRQILRNDEEVKRFIPEWPEIQPWRQILVGLDTGSDHPFGAVKLVSSENALIVVDDYLERDKSFMQHSTALKYLAQSSTTKWAINRNERQQITELAQHGIYCQKADNDQISGIERIKSWLIAGKLYFVGPRVERTIKQMKAYRWAPKKDGEPLPMREKVYKLHDELPDAMRYALMTWPDLPKDPALDPSPPRDLSALPEEQQAAIRRMRKIDGEQKETPQTVTGDFWQ